ncbi:hypothetical protein PQ610_03030 [Tardisphaera miroshnichenkoae]
MMSELKKEIFELLDKDAEFRYAIAGYLGLGDIMKKLDEHSEILKQLLESTNKLWESNNKLWEEVKALREGQDKLWQENQKIWEELKSLREDMQKGFAAHEEEMRKLREDMNAGFQKHEQEIQQLREDMQKGFAAHEEEMRKLREDMNAGFQKHEQEIQQLREEQAAIRRSQEDLSNQLNGVWKAIGGLRSALGVSLEDYTIGFVSMLLEKQGYDTTELSIRNANFTIEGKPLQIDVFCEDPLIIGEVTTHLSSKEEAEREVYKLQERVDALEKLLQRKSYMKLLAVATAPEDVVEFLKKLSKERGITFVSGRELDSQAFSAR